MFDLFDSNGGGTIDAEELDLALRSVGICLSEIDIVGVLDSMDKDGTLRFVFLYSKNILGYVLPLCCLRLYHLKPLAKVLRLKIF